MVGVDVVGDVEGCSVGETVGLDVLRVGILVVGKSVGITDGEQVGESEGFNDRVGDRVGGEIIEGENVGFATEGNAVDGITVGNHVGNLVGCSVGLSVGKLGTWGVLVTAFEHRGEV